jgi:hypothetical protein
MTAYDITDWTYQGVSYNFATIEPRGLEFKSTDGSQIYVIDAADDKVKAFNLNVAWNVSTAVDASDEFQLEVGAQGLSISSDGLNLLYVDGQTIKRRVLGTAWDLSTAGAATSLNVASDHALADPQDVTWANSGAIIYFTDDEDQTVKSYDLLTPYDLSTATIDAVELDISVRFPLGEGLAGIFIKPAGDTLFVGVDYATDGSFHIQSPAVRQFNLSTVFDLSTATEIVSTDANIASLLSFMPHFATADYDWVIGRNKAGTYRTVQFGDAQASGAYLGGLSSGEGGMGWDDADNDQFWGISRVADCTWEGSFRFFREPDPPSLGGDNRLCFGSCDSNHHSLFVETLARPWGIVWNGVTTKMGLMASGSGAQVTAGPEGDKWFYGFFLDFVITREDAGGNQATFRFWVNGEYLGARTTTQGAGWVNNAFAYGKNGGIPGWDYASGIQQSWIRAYSVRKYTTTESIPALNVDETALNIIGRSVVEETGRTSTATYLAFSDDGLFGYVTANDATVGNYVYQYNLDAVIPSCTGDGFEAYASGGEARLHVTGTGGAHHLEGLTVTAVVDGAVYDATITDGQIVLPDGISGAHIQVGFPFTSDIVTLDIEEGDGQMQGKDKAVRELLIKFYKSVMPLIGPARDKLVQMKNPEKSDFDEPLPLYSGKVRQRIERDWNPSGKVVMRVKDPFPLTVIAVAPDVPEVEPDK